MTNFTTDICRTRFSVALRIGVEVPDVWAALRPWRYVSLRKILHRNIFGHPCINPTIPANPVKKPSPPTEEVVFSGGSAGASSQAGSPPMHFAVDAFRLDGNFWASADPMPVYLWYDFKNKFYCPVKISFLPRQDSLHYGVIQNPTSFQFIGSNDDPCNAQSSWDVLCEKSSLAPISSLEEIRQCDVKEPSLKFRCIGIKVKSVQEGSVASLDNVRMWVSV